MTVAELTGKQPFIIFEKRSILDVLQGSNTRWILQVAFCFTLLPIILFRVWL